MSSRVLLVANIHEFGRWQLRIRIRNLAEVTSHACVFRSRLSMRKLSASTDPSVPQDGTLLSSNWEAICLLPYPITPPSG